MNYMDSELYEFKTKYYNYIRMSSLLIGRLRSPATPYLGGLPAARGAYVGNYGYQQPVTYGFQQGLMYSPYG